jgi:hypothetical protein
MDIKKLAGLVILILILIMGCLGNYGKIRKQTGIESKVTLSELRDNWAEYDIYFGRRSNRYADAIMFDPKNNNTRLSGDSWIKIEDQETLDERIKDLHRVYSWAGVYLIEGENNQVFGYMYYPGYFHVAVSIVDERTLYVSSLPKYKSTP